MKAFRLAFTLVEALTCLAIMLVVAAVMVPVMVRSRIEARAAECISNLHQIQLSVALYRQDDNGSPSGNSYEMGFPPADVWGAMVKKLSLRCRGTLADSVLVPHGYIYMIMEPTTSTGKLWEAYAEKYGENAMLVSDWNHNSLYEVRQIYSPKLGLGVTIGGTVLRKRYAGAPFLEQWWHQGENK